MKRKSVIKALLLIAALGLTLVSCSGATSGGGNTGVDLTPAALTYTGSSVDKGASLSVTLTVQNLGSDSVSTSFGVDFYLTLNSTFNTASDTHLGSATVAGIGGNTSKNVGASLTIPGSGLTYNQDFYVYAVVDAAGVVTETNKTNNTSTISTAAVVLVYDSTNGSRTYNVTFETYAPTGTGTVDTGMAIWQGTSTCVASQNVGGAGPGFASITTSLGPGTYYITVISWSNYDGYAMSIRTSNISTRPTFSTRLTSNSQDSYEPDDTPQVFPIDTGGTTSMSTPTAPVVMKTGAAVNRYSAAGDWDWFEVVLP